MRDEKEEKPGRTRRNTSRTAMLICCTRDEADRIRAAAKKERRSISAFVLNAVMTRFAVEGRLQERREQVHSAAVHGNQNP